MDLDFSSARSAVATGKVILDVLHRYKYHRALWFEPFLAQLFIGQAAPVLRSGNWDFLVPVPLHPAKRREREFNQAERMAEHLSGATGIPVNKYRLRRVRPTETQTHLTRALRADNVRRAFAMRNGEPTDFDGRRIVLVDDVFTTGATTNACAAVLRDAGAAEVCVWTVARGL
jgi:ComF family protein